MKNYTNSEPKLPPPVYAPEDAAKVILHAATHPIRDAFVGGAARVISTFAQMAPRTLDILSEKVAFQAQLGPNPPSPGNNLWQGMAQARVRGNHQGSFIRPSLYSNAAVHPVITMAVAGAAVAGLGWLVMRKRAESQRQASRDFMPPLDYVESGDINVLMETEAMEVVAVVPLADVATAGTSFPDSSELQADADTEVVVEFVRDDDEARQERRNTL